jgi:hypothetical protein
MNQTDFIKYIRLMTKNPSFTLTTDEVGLFNEYLSLYTSQLIKMGMFDMSIINNQKAYDIPFCQLDYLPVPIWQEGTTNKPLIIQKKNAKTGDIKDLFIDKDYDLEFIVIGDYKYIIGVNFKCLSCNCECEKIIINGVYGFRVDEEISNFIYLILFKNLSSTLPTGNSCKENIKSESTGNYSVTYYDKPTTGTNTTAFSSNPLMISSYPQVADLLGFYRKYFIQLY